MKLNNLFPTQYRAFYRGELSCCAERFGGIDSISILDIRECNGKLYPDRMKFPWFCRNMSSTMGRPLYSPAIQFRYGRKLYVPENAELYPFGFKTDAYSMVITDKAFSFRFKAPEKAPFSMIISKFHTTHVRNQKSYPSYLSTHGYAGSCDQRCTKNGNCL